MDDSASQRDRMVEHQIARRGVRDQSVLEAMRRIPREEFISRDQCEFAYDDTPLSIEAGQTISQPYIVALMLEAAQLRTGDRVLEVGAGSGYAAAVIAAIVGRVYAIERHAILADLARERFARLGYDNIESRTGDGSGGWPEAAPFDAILVAAAAPRVPEALQRQLAIGGRLVLPVGDILAGQRLLQVLRVGEDEFQRKNLGAVMFVPLVGEYGWDRSGRPAPQIAMPPQGSFSPVVKPSPETDRK